MSPRSRRLVWPAAVLILVLLAVLAVLESRRAQSQAPTAPAAAAPVAALALQADEVLTLREQPLLRGLAVSGTLRAVNSAVLKAKVAGELKSLQPREGDTVRVGQTIGQIDASETTWRAQQAEQGAQAAQAQADITRRQLDNSRALVAQGFISPTAVETALGNDNAARANLQGAQAAVALARKARADTRLLAPISGQVASRAVQPGERLAVDSRILEIVDLSRLELEAALTPEEAAQLPVGATARLQIEGQATPLTAQVTRISPATQAGTRAVLAYLALPGGPGLRVGLFASGRIELARFQALALPLTAVRLDEAQPYVLSLVNSPTGLMIRRLPVVLGPQAMPAQAPDSPTPWVVVKDGLPAGSRVLSAAVGTVPDLTPARLLAATPAPAP